MSWAWRPFLSRPCPVLRPARRHGSQLSTVFDRNNLIGSRGYASKSDGDAKRHLYVVLDDHKDGFSVHKLDLGNDNNHDGLNGGATRRLTEPPVLRVTLTTLGERAQFAGVGSSIVAIGSTVFSPMLKDRWMPDHMGGVLIYDTKSSTLTVAPHLPRGLQRSGYKAAMAFGNSLYMLGSEQPLCPCWEGGGSLHCLTKDPAVDQEGDGFWGWEPLSDDDSPWCWSSYDHPPMGPFLAEYITAYAANTSPPGAEAQHEILVSVRPTERSVLGATFSFSRATSKWTWHGGWLLPVVGHAHYDGHLDAWVGLHAVKGGNKYGDYYPRVTDGHLCAGNVTSAPTWWNVGKEKLFRLNDEDAVAGWRHADAKLVPIAQGEDGSEYCLMERMRPKEEEKLEETTHNNCWGDGDRCLLRLTTFHVERGQYGEPMALARLPTRSYEFSSHNRHFDAQGFWM